MSSYVPQLKKLAYLLNASPDFVSACLVELENCGLLPSLQHQVEGVVGFETANFESVTAFSLYRSLLYCAVRIQQPKLVVETGTLHGISAAFILQALEKNGHGQLISLDLPSRDLSLSHQGTMMLPHSKSPGWVVPQHLRERYQVREGRSETLLPQLFDEGLTPDIFLHDSDHSYVHMMLEMSLAYTRMKQGIIIVDNIEQNSAFDDFCQNCDGASDQFSSYDSDVRRWQHGILVK